jgi:hypothetical protein
LYQFLGVRTKASYAELADAIDEAVLEGLNGKTIQLARETLLDPDSRAAYDAEHGIESAAAIMDAAEPVSRLPHTGLRLPAWLSFGKRKTKPSTTSIPVTPTEETEPTTSHQTNELDIPHSAQPFDDDAGIKTDIQAAQKATPKLPLQRPNPNSSVTIGITFWAYVAMPVSRNSSGHTQCPPQRP